MYEWKDWALGAGIVFFVLIAGVSASYGGSGVGSLLYATLGAVCAYYYGVRAPVRRQAGAARRTPHGAATAWPAVPAPPQPPQFPPGAG